MNETDELYDRIQELNDELERQRTINKTIAHDIQKGLEIILAKPSKLHIVAIPCCAEQNIPGKIDIGYIDRNIWSPKNEVRIWRKL